MIAWYVSMYVCDYGLQIDLLPGLLSCMCAKWIYLFIYPSGWSDLFIYLFIVLYMQIIYLLTDVCMVCMYGILRVSPNGRK